MTTRQIADFDHGNNYVELYEDVDLYSVLINNKIHVDAVDLECASEFFAEAIRAALLHPLTPQK